MSRESGRSSDQERQQRPQSQESASKNIAPGKVPLVKDDASRRASSGPAPASAEAPVQRKSSWALTTDPVMDVAHRGAVQARGDVAQDAESVHQAASEGIASGGSALPFADRIQASFGAQHDVSSVQAHVGGAAAAASESMGAQAYATGNHVAFGSAPSLHTAAHEAAHVVQQRAGVSLAGGVGQAGDSYERNADAVADRVVRGESAADLLGAGGAGGGASGVQKKAVQFDIKSDLRSAVDGWGTDESAIYRRLERATLPELQSVVADPALMARLREDLNQSEMSRVLDLLRAPLPAKLRLAMQGWGTDEAYIHRSIATATAADLAAVTGDPGLVNQLEGELSGAELQSVFNRLNLPVSRKLEYAVRGWGTDENYIFEAIQTGPLPEVMAVGNNAALLARVDGDLSGGELNRWRGLLAKRIYLEGANALRAFSICMGTAEDRAARLAWIGDLTVQQALLDVVITTATDGNAVIQAFQSYWSVETRVVEGATTWPPATVKAIHVQMKLLPSQDTRSGVWRQLSLTSDPALISRAAWNGGSGDLIVGSNASTSFTVPMGHGAKLGAAAGVGATTVTVTEPSRYAVNDKISVSTANRSTQDKATITAIAGNQYTIDTALTNAYTTNDWVLPDDATARREVNWLDATVRHEIAHSVETALGGVTGFTVGLGGWWTGNDFDTWANAMGSPWQTNDGSTITDEDKGKIKDVIVDAVSKGTADMTASLAADHPIITNWGKNVPVIVAAHTCLSKGDRFYQNASALYAANGKRFTVSNWYKCFMYHNEDVVSQRVADYGLYAPAEFFAEAYTVFYEEAGRSGVTDADYGRLIRNSTWRSWIRTNIHNRGQAPAGTGATTGGPSSSGEGGARPGGAGFGRSSGNPGP
jgi:hypothetical protein